MILLLYLFICKLRCFTRVSFVTAWRSSWAAFFLSHMQIQFGLDT